MDKDHLQIILENIDCKFNVVIEGYNALDQKIDSVRDELKQDIAHLDFKIDTVNNHLSGRMDKLDAKIDAMEANLNKKIDAVAADIKAHRADTEAHGGIYRVKES